MSPCRECRRSTIALGRLRAGRRVHRGAARPGKQAALDNQIERLNMLRPNDPPLPFPWSSQLEGELRELRCHYGPELSRVIYRHPGNLFVLLHVFRKDTGKVPKAELRIARERWEDFKARMEAPRRRPPRAAGHDAP
ncbi:MAG: type II toxin-antitoxin system RelE/ParE family toxin [Gaiellaceae bacterium]